MRTFTISVFAIVLIASGCSDNDDPSDASSGDTVSTDTAPSDTDSSDTASADTSSSDGPSLDTEAADTVSSDGTATDGADGTDGIAFRITSPRSDRPVGYRMKVVENPSKVRDGSRFEAEEDNDTIADQSDGWLITGETGTAPSADEVHGDSYRWDAVPDPAYGIAGWSADAPADDYTITINGTEVDPDSLPELMEETDRAGCLGGGACYDDAVTAGDADITVAASADLGDLRSALGNASSGDVVFVESGADIDLGFDPNSTAFEVPAGVTLASDRGVDGSEGARLRSQKRPSGQQNYANTIAVNDNARITGFRIEGPTPDREMNWSGSPSDYTKGILARGTSDVEIDNNELYGWPNSAVTGGDPIHVHHNDIHDNDQKGLGYGVSDTEWDTVIEYNRFRRNRHGIQGTGGSGDGYIARYNVFGAEGIPGAFHQIDMHEDGNNGKAGSRMEVHHNTVKFPDAQGVFVRGTPRDNAEIYNNWLYNPTEPCLTKDRGSYCAIEVRADDWTNVDRHDNHFGSSEPDCAIGAPRDGC